MEKVIKHLPHYFSLFTILMIGFVVFIAFSNNPTFQSYVALATAAAYVTWGIVNHFIHKDLYASVVVEYIAVALLGLVIIFSLIT